MKQPYNPDKFREQNPEAPQWWQNRNEPERFVISFTSFLFLAMLIVYVVTFVDVLNFVRVVDDFAANLMTEAFSIAVTVLIIERLNQRRSEKQRKEELILQMGSTDNGMALEAVRLLRYYGWLRDGSLYQANLKRANLANANLTNAVLTQANLKRANLTNANLKRANLTNANLTQTNLKRANLKHANLMNTLLLDANLTNANLTNANLANANLWNANLTNADLWNALLLDTLLWDTNLTNAKLKRANLPDGTNWTPDTDMERFTNPGHPEFWQKKTKNPQ